MITASLTATLASLPTDARAADPPAGLYARALRRAGLDRPVREVHRWRAALVPLVEVGGAVERLQSPRFTATSVNAFARLSWPLDQLRHDPAALAAERRASSRRESLVTRIAEVWQRREALRAAAAGELAEAEADAELTALTGEDADGELP